jgi:hypothetical protein
VRPSVGGEDDRNFRMRHGAREYIAVRASGFRATP